MAASEDTEDRQDDGLIAGDDGRRRCWWCGDDPLYVAYHDREWGRPVHDDTRLFEKLVLEGFQSGLAWITILRKREAFR
ncbi:MAG: DNA-3-methyladenine glycosylase I, partial [Actinobacteria bacterium]|nr:DNA-3-methyladenine glycosylase I [Actinomycetota bacterium]